MTRRLDAVVVATACTLTLALGMVWGATLQRHRDHQPHLIPPLTYTSPAPASTPASRDLVRVPLDVVPSSAVTPPEPPTAQLNSPAATISATGTPTAQPNGWGSPTAAQWARLRHCESGDDYANKANPRYRGAYQIGFAEWADKGGYRDPADAPPALQDQRAKEMWGARGWSPWYSSSTCSGLR